MTHVPLLWKRPPTEAHLRFTGAPDDFYTHSDERPFPTRARLSARLSASLARPVAVDGGRGDFILSADAAAPLAGLPADVAVLRPVALRDHKGKPVRGDFVYLDVRAVAPIDRSSAKATWKRGHLDKLHALAWAPARAPRPAIFRVAECPQHVFIAAALAAAIDASTGGRLGTRDPGDLAQSTVWLLHPDAHDPVALPAGAERAAEAAFWSLYAGEPAARAAACKSPLWAYYLARLVDGKPRPDTRAAAQRHTSVAALYAMHVERKHTPAGERACAPGWWSAQRYAECFGKLGKTALAALVASGYEADDIRAETAKIHAFLVKTA